MSQRCTAGANSVQQAISAGSGGDYAGFIGRLVISTGNGQLVISSVNDQSVHNGLSLYGVCTAMRNNPRFSTDWPILTKVPRIDQFTTVLDSVRKVSCRCRLPLRRSWLGHICRCPVGVRSVYSRYDPRIDSVQHVSPRVGQCTAGIRRRSTRVYSRCTVYGGVQCTAGCTEVYSVRQGVYSRAASTVLYLRYRTVR